MAVKTVVKSASAFALIRSVQDYDVSEDLEREARTAARRARGSAPYASGELSRSIHTKKKRNSVRIQTEKGIEYAAVHHWGSRGSGGITKKEFILKHVNVKKFEIEIARGFRSKFR